MLNGLRRLIVKITQYDVLNDIHVLYIVSM